MTLQECYQAIEGDYTDVISRLRSDRLVQKFVLKFLDDPSFDLLCRSVEEKNYEEAFRAAHTIKGVCQNLGFTRLLESSSHLTEALRSGWSEEAPGLFEQTAADYKQTAAAIQALRETLESSV